MNHLLLIRAYTIVGLSGLNSLSGLGSSSGALGVNLVPSNNISPGFTRYWDFGQFGNTNGLYNTLMQAPQ